MSSILSRVVQLQVAPRGLREANAVKVERAKMKANAVKVERAKSKDERD